MSKPFCKTGGTCIHVDPCAPGGCEAVCLCDQWAGGGCISDPECPIHGGEIDHVHPDGEGDR